MNFKSLLGSFVSGNAGSASHMKNLIEMAAADGHLHESEKALLKTMAKRYGISESHLDEIQKNPDKVELEVPRDERKKFQQLYELITMMGIDDHIDSKEVDLAKVLAIKFGYKPEIAGELVEIIRENIKNGSSVDETMKRPQLMIA
jgi:uncharacterized tellurite resistance protein B-like protein